MPTRGIQVGIWIIFGLVSLTSSIYTNLFQSESVLYGSSKLETTGASNSHLYSHACQTMGLSSSSRLFHWYIAKDIHISILFLISSERRVIHVGSRTNPLVQV